MKTSALDLARAAVSALTEALDRNGLSSSPHELLRLLTSAAGERANMLTVTIATPTGDAGPFAQSVAQLLEKETGKSVVIRQIADATLIGGAVITFLDQRIDCSVRRSLQDAEGMLTSSH